MFVVLLKFSGKKDQAGRHMEGHKSWLQSGFDDGVFVVAGSLQPNQGGAVIVYNTSRDALRKRVEADPFVAEGVVKAEILEISPFRAEERLAFLLD
ncbi:MAG: YciI family protein [Rhodospirillales bacterium]|nr:YciI family protein [Rhodospirillales bacterium]